MGIFSKKEVVFLKNSNAAEEQLQELQNIREHYDLSKQDEDRIDRDILLVKAGIEGEKRILFELENADMNLVVLHDLCLKNKAGQTAQIDFFLITPRFRILLECKNLYGNITIDRNGQFIRTISYGKRYWKEGLDSPITQNERHLKIYRDVMEETIANPIQRFNFTKVLFNGFHKSYVVLANAKTVLNDRYAPKEIRDQVIRADQLISTLKKLEKGSSDLPLSLKEMKEIGEGMLRRNVEERTDYATKYNAIKKETVEKTEIKDQPLQLICPRCGRPLVLRIAKKGDHAGEQFYGCSGFPHCRYVLKK